MISNKPELSRQIRETINVDRIGRRLDDLEAIGQTSEGGVTRLAYTEEENEGHEYILNQLPDDYKVTIDSIGNIFATRDPDSDHSTLTGSHLDSVQNAGRLDGTLGVVISLEAVEAFHRVVENPELPPTLVIFRAEESSRFGQHTIGSKAALGKLNREILSATDKKGVPVWQAMKNAGFQPNDLSEPYIDFNRITNFFEVHIEQGPVLEAKEKNVGIVSSIRAPVRYRVTIDGKYDHSGATSMNLRNDALAGASEMIHAIETVAVEASQIGDVVATVGDIESVEGAINKVCGKVKFPIDIRSDSLSFRKKVEAEILDQIRLISNRREIATHIDQIDESDPVELSESIRQTLLKSAEETGCDYCVLPSGGGHDAMNFQLEGIPTGLLFVPSIEGISHNPAEETTTEGIEEATETLVNTLVTLEQQHQA